MRERTVDLNSVAWNDDRASADDRPTRASFFSRLIHWHVREWLMVAGVVLAVGAVAINALFLQTGPHPAPMFANRGPSPVASFENSFTLPRPRPTDAKPDQKAEIPMPTPSRATRPLPIVRRGEPVSLVVMAAGFTVTRAAVADQDGAVGDTIRIRTERGQQPIVGQVMADGRILLPGFN